MDVLVTDCGIAVNPLCPDLMECLDNAGIPHITTEALKKKAYSLVGRPDDLEWEDKVVAVLEARDGTILDVVRKIKPFILAMILVLGGYISLDGVESMIKAGFSSTAPTAALFVFSVLYFGIMTDAGMFDVIIGKLMKLVGNSVIGVTV